jgi:hypothetical protein
LPSKLGSDLREVRVVIAYVDRAPFGREFFDLITSGAVYFHHQFREGAEVGHFASAKIINLAVRGRTCRGHEKCIDRVLDVGEVAQLFSTPDRDWVAFQ